MKQAYDIWNEVLETLGFKFKEEYTMWRTSNLLVYFKEELEANLYVKFETGEVTSFMLDGWQMKETFQKENLELFRSVKLKHLLEI